MSGKNENFTPVIIAEWPRSTREVFRVSLHFFQGRPVFSVRAWYRGPDGELRPGKDGLTAGIHHLAPSIDALVEAYRLACAHGFITPEIDDASR